MHSRIIRIRKLGLLTIRPLQNGDTATVAALFDQLGLPSSAELAQLATEDSRHHALVAHVEGDPRPAGIGQLARAADEWTRGEIVLAVADRYQGHAVGSALVELLAADARAAGITHLRTTQSSNGAEVSELAGASRGERAPSEQPTLPPPVRAGVRGRLGGGFNRSSQRLSGRSCDEREESEVRSGWVGR